ncbi:collagenase [Amyelois transitella]|uniref:collagenase n=1 Tax=Amyelois transitella TaxID=680683 RepID=UPI00298FC17C|nr:collagenase [Amyelois transitella]
MKSLVLFIFLISTVYSAHINFRNYHEEIGIPLATKVKQLEAEAIAKLSSNGRIAGGSLIDISAVPYQAAVVIHLPTNTDSLCGGALISSTRVVSAAHCQRDDSGYTIGLGSNFAFSGGVRVAVTNFIMHPGYSHSDWTLIHDIAMIHIPAVSFTNAIQPISLPNSAEVANNFAGQIAVASGYGITPEIPTLTWDQVLRAVDLQIITPAQCGSSYGDLGARNETICTHGSGGVGPCSSDSGGPLTTFSNNRRILIGITSFGQTCGATSPNGFVRITQYLSWILSN